MLIFAHILGMPFEELFTSSATVLTAAMLLRLWKVPPRSR